MKEKLKVALVSLGCSKNLVDSEVMLKLLSEDSYKIITDSRDADIIIVNTCGFIESAKQESIDSILEMGQLKTEGSCKVLIASGCLAERYKEDLMNEMPELDAVIGTGDYKDIKDVVEQALQGQKVIKYGNQENIDINELPRTISTLGASAYLKIAEGCDNKCSYCAIPKIRGKYRSRRMEDIVAEAEYLAQNGIKEVNVIAQDTTRYGYDLYGSYKISELLAKICEIQGIEWIRLLYSYPDEFSDELISTIAQNPKICKYLDIPVQHASDHILKKMHRRSSKEKISKLIGRLREAMPEISIRTSLIVGFPGESKEDYEELLDFVKDTRFDRLGVFTYSKEEDTPAFDMEGHLDEEVKLERQEEIMLVQKQISYESNKKMIGKTLKVLIEGMDGERYFGRSYKDAPEIDGYVYFAAAKSLLSGDFCEVVITSSDEYDLVGVLEDELGK